MRRKRRMPLLIARNCISGNKKQLFPYAFLLPGLIGITIFYFLPLLDVVRRSFTDALATRAVGIENYIAVWQNGNFLLAFKNTLLFLVVSIPLLLVLSLGTALLIKHVKGKKELFRTTLLLPLGIPAACSVLFFRILFDQNGWLNQLLFMADSGKQWLKGGSAFGVLVFCYIWKNTGYDMILWSAGLQGIDPSLYEAAKVDGGSGFHIFKYITMPLLKPTCSTIIILSVLNTFKIFREAYLLAGDYPDRHIYLLQHLFNNWFVALDIQKMTAAAVSVAAGVLMLIYLPVFWPRMMLRGQEYRMRKNNRSAGCGTRREYRMRKKTRAQDAEQDPSIGCGRRREHAAGNRRQKSQERE